MGDELKLVRTGADHGAALAELERFWCAGRGTAGGDRADILATLIDAHEGGA